MKKEKTALALLIMLFASLCFAESAGNISVSGIETPGLWGIVITSTSTTTTINSTNGTAESSSGSQSPSTTTTIPNKIQTWPSMAAGTQYNITDIDSAIGVRSLLIQLTDGASNVRITISALSAKPSSIASNPGGTSYKYFEITAVNLSNSVINYSKIEFTVEKWWIDVNRVNKSNIVLNRYYSGTWSQLNTTYIRELSDSYVYSALTPGFSTFAISVKPSAAVTTLPVLGSSLNTTQNATANQTNGFDISAITLPPGSTEWIMIAIVIIIIATLAYLKRHVILRVLSNIKSNISKKPWEKVTQ